MSIFLNWHICKSIADLNRHNWSEICLVLCQIVAEYRFKSRQLEPNMDGIVSNCSRMHTQKWKMQDLHCINSSEIKQHLCQIEHTRKQQERKLCATVIKVKNARSTLFQLKWNKTAIVANWTHAKATRAQTVRDGDEHTHKCSALTKHKYEHTLKPVTTNEEQHFYLLFFSYSTTICFLTEKLFYSMYHTNLHHITKLVTIQCNIVSPTFTNLHHSSHSVLIPAHHHQH